MAKGLNRKLNFGVRVHEVSRIRRKAIDQVMKPLGITGGQWWVLTYISLHNGRSQVELADELNMGKVALGGLIDRLEKSGLVERRPDLADRRMKRIHLSKQGREMVRKIRKTSADIQDAALAGISDEDLDIADAVLEKMDANLRRLVSR